MGLCQPFGHSSVLFGIALLLAVVVSRAAGGTISPASLDQETISDGALVAVDEAVLFDSGLLRAPVNVESGVEGDVTGDSFVDGDDIQIISDHWLEMGPPSPPGDANVDDIVNIFDVNFVSSRWAPKPIPEPSSLVLLAFALPTLWWVGRAARR